MSEEKTVEQEKVEVVDLLSSGTPEVPDRKGYEYYAAKAQEATDADTDTTTTTDTDKDPAGTVVPDKFKGKSVDEIIESYTQLETEFGRRNNELGSLRRLNDQLLELDKPTEKAAPAERTKVEVDTLLEDPDATINAAVDSNPRLKQLEEKLISRDREDAKTAFESKHKNYEEVLATEEFQAWVLESSVRKQLLVDAHQKYEYDKADELFTLYDEIKGNKIADAKAERDAAARKSVEGQVTETSSVTEKGGEKFKRSQIISLRINNPAKYEQFKARINEAYHTGNVINDLQ